MAPIAVYRRWRPLELYELQYRPRERAGMVGGLSPINERIQAGFLNIHTGSDGVALLPR